MNILTTEQQCAYKHGRSTIDILSLVQNSIQRDETQQLILVDLSKAFDSIDRDAMWAIAYQQGLPWETIKQIRMGHNGAKF